MADIDVYAWMQAAGFQLEQGNAAEVELRLTRNNEDESQSIMEVTLRRDPWRPAVRVNDDGVAEVVEEVVVDGADVPPEDE